MLKDRCELYCKYGKFVLLSFLTFSYAKLYDAQQPPVSVTAKLLDKARPFDYEACRKRKAWVERVVTRQKWLIRPALKNVVPVEMDVVQDSNIIGNIEGGGSSARGMPTKTIWWS